MIKRNLPAGILLMSILMFFFSGTMMAQQSKALSIGDPAPPLRYSKWIKGEPIKSLDGDQLYVLEFWATWCGPCKAAMPHLTKLQQEYTGKATFIGVGVWEKVGKDEPYETSLPSVEKFVKGNDAYMGYAVIADNNEQFMGNNWLKAAGENGIPSTFIVKDNKILWIGHPNSIDSTLPKILNGTYDMLAFKSGFERRAEAGRKQAALTASYFKPIEEAIKAKDFRQAFELMEKVKVEQPNYKPMMSLMKFSTLLNYVSQEEAIAFAKEWQKEGKSIPSLILGEVYNKEGFSKTTYLWAARNYESTSPGTNANPIVFHALAACYAKGGDYSNAVVNEEKALEGAKKALKDGTMIGSIMDYTVTEYEEKLNEYKQKMK